jgi:heptosyltransferase-2
LANTDASARRPAGAGHGDPAGARVRDRLARIGDLLLIRLRSLGDSILSLPLLQALHDWRPDLALDVLVESPFAPVFRHHPAVRELLIVRPKAGAPDRAWGRARAALEIRRRSYAAVLNLHGGTTSLMFVLASGAPLRIGQERFRASQCYNARIPSSCEVWGRRGIHTVEHQLTFLKWLGLPLPENSRPTLSVDLAARAQIARRLAASSLEPGFFLLVQPTATLFTKQWPERNFALLADRLAESHGLPVVFSAGLHEEPVLRRVAQSAGRKHIYWSDLDLASLFALIEACRLFIGNDSGPTHAAAALARPVAVVWGSSDFDAWHPWGTRFESIRSDLPCMPCPGYSCAAFGEPRCILEIPVDRVLTACERLL